MIDSLYFSYNLGIGISENNFSSDNFVLYPNPTADNSTLFFNNKDNVSLEFFLYNSTGELVNNIKNVRTNYIILDNKNISNGLYFFTLKTVDKKIAFGKLLIER